MLIVGTVVNLLQGETRIGAEGLCRLSQPLSHVRRSRRERIKGKEWPCQRKAIWDDSPGLCLLLSLASFTCCCQGLS